ncbi:type II CAAX endopeptidase family protein [Xanthocytophaga agilis]|uniref:Type II CAAX endopeptidase family protein n=1 Tax=Xanthocytophaga agilis TaxID=3048010 RepID=A0AAE3R8S1_9BACT|nr:type II CAAX endopeptidase family protein [Xanthocytophaga agilis]MDJ1505340.1 type II CAAX endopeptidase family protein [Xanthocytophaga agilis]
MLKYSLFRDLSVFFLLIYGITWLIWSPYYAGALFPSSWHTSPVFHLAGSWGPLLASLLATYFVNGKAGLQILRQRVTRTGTDPWPLTLACFLPFVLLTFSILISVVVNQTSFSFQGLGTSREIPGLSVPEFVGINILVIGLGEEMGWRGFVLPRLQSEMSAMKASILLSVFWAIWHWPLFFYPLSGYYHMDIFGVAGWLFSLLLGSILFTCFFNSSSGSVLVCAVFHGTMDIAFTSDFANPNLTSYNGMLITILGFLVTQRFGAEHLARKDRVCQYTS